MSTQHQAEIHKRLWAIANALRANSNLEPHEFKNYILGIIFYKFLSERVEDQAAELLKHNDESYEEAWSESSLREDLTNELVELEGYAIEPKFLFKEMVKAVKENCFDTEMLQGAINNINRSTLGHVSEEAFYGLFEDMDLSTTRLGKDVKTRSSFMAKIISEVNQFSFRHDDVDIDVLGDAYEYMISNFAATAGKKAGEFYTPQSVSSILAKIVTTKRAKLRNVYDPTCGSGSLLLRVAKSANVGTFYGQELTSTTYNLARMNMMLHGVPYNRFHLHNDNTLVNPADFGDVKFDAIVANPPYSANWEPKEELLNDDRFSGYGKLAPASKADFAFVQHMLHNLAEDGTMAVVLPHGVLFRGAAEGAIRKVIVDNNWLDAVIGLPANIFFGTSIPTAVLVFKKNREVDANVLFVDASNGFVKGKNQNILSNENVDMIVDNYRNRSEVDGYSIKINKSTIADNDYNLNIPRYVTAAEKEENIDLIEVERHIGNVEIEINQLSAKIKLAIEVLQRGAK